ncbi:MAG TPA: S24 family peptidase [Gemmatimonadaceae bacterium]|nr:S24 family peptidase [Gemmatimonadaceae bacterium]
MISDSDRSIYECMAVVGRNIESQDEQLAFQDEKFLSWLAGDLREDLNTEERTQDELDATDFARRALIRLAVRRADRALPRRPLRERTAPIAATIEQSADVAKANRCATLLDLAVAAGQGREIWDEPCDRWLELPDDISSGRYVALRVAGDSMTPVLCPREVILIQLDSTPRVDDLVVARLPDQSHVVKRIASIKDSSIELASFNPDYRPIFVAREPSPVVGTVIARFTRE